MISLFCYAHPQKVVFRVLLVTCNKSCLFARISNGIVIMFILVGVVDVVTVVICVIILIVGKVIIKLKVEIWNIIFIILVLDAC
jgi:hypothetical protein